MVLYPQMHSQGNAGAKKAVMIELHTFPTEESQSIPTVTVSPGAAFPVQARPPEEAMTHRPHGHLLPSQPKQHKGSLPQKGLVRISSCLQDKALLVPNHSPILPPVFFPRDPRAYPRAHMHTCFLGPSSASLRRAHSILCLLEVSRHTSKPRVASRSLLPPPAHTHQPAFFS